MRELKFYGASDDLFEIDDPAGDQEIGCYDTPAIVEVRASSGRLCVVAMYAPANAVGCWSIGIMPADEDVHMPAWEAKWKLADRGYSTELTLIVPDDAVVVVLHPTAED